MSDINDVIETIGKVTYVYKGGAYIEMFWAVDWSWNKREAIPFAVINVYDYAKGEPTIEPSYFAVTAHVKEWLAENADEIETYWENSPPAVFRDLGRRA